MIVPDKSSHVTWVILVLSLLLLPAGGSSGNEADLQAEIVTLYSEMELEGSFDFEPFKLAVVGYANLRDGGQLKKLTPLSIIDYTKPSTDKRMVIVDVAGGRLLYNALIAHGKNTGDNYAVNFSNEHETRMSSLGFYATGETYYGKRDYSLRLHGLEKDFNGNALDRGIVLHGAWYATQDFIDKYGRLGRSWGCPALPPDITVEIIDLIKEGSCLFIYFDDSTYLENSVFLDEKRATEWFAENGGSWNAVGQ